MKLLTDDPWQAITRAVRKSPGKCRVAVAYFGRGASKLLPLKLGSVLVLDFSESAVRAGQVCPDEVLRLLRLGVEVHSVTNLHAKVFVVGQGVFVGSTNVSRASADTLVEAVVHGTDQSLVRQSARFVESLLGEHITPEYAQRMAKIYRPPKFGGGHPKTHKATNLAPGHARTWVVQLKLIDWDKQDYAAEKKGKPIAQRRLKSPRRFEVDDFFWTGDAFARRVKTDELVVQVLKETPQRFMVSPPERVRYVRNYRNAKGNLRSMIFLEKPKALRRKTLQRVRKIIGPSAALLRRKFGLTLLRDAQLIHRLHQLWPRIS